MKLKEYTKITSLGDSAVRIEFGNEISLEVYNRIKIFMKYLNEAPEKTFKEVIPSFSCITILYDPLELMKNNENPYKVIEEKIADILEMPVYELKEDKIIIEIPVCYGGDFGADLEELANYHNITTEEVIQRHTNRDYFVYMLGFAPGFPFLGGVDDKIATPRKQTPRLKIAPGSVGIAGSQTGIYPIETPGGWQIIGRTPLDLFTPNEESPTLLKAGYWIHFNEISEKEFHEIKEGLACQLHA